MAFILAIFLGGAITFSGTNKLVELGIDGPEEGKTMHETMQLWATYWVTVNPLVSMGLLKTIDPTMYVNLIGGIEVLFGLGVLYGAFGNEHCARGSAAVVFAIMAGAIYTHFALNDANYIGAAVLGGAAFLRAFVITGSAAEKQKNE